MRKNKLSLALQIAVNADNLPSRTMIRTWLSLCFKTAAEISVRIVDEEEGKQLNLDYRQKDYATNVLTFTYDDADMPTLPDMPLLGDIVLCHPVIVREAAAQNKTLLAHYAHLVVHAALHCQGFDHEIEAEAEEMEAKEIQLLAGLGFANPYTEM